jgi:uncharacterized FAD-dependent dehydrogenase
LEELIPLIELKNLHVPAAEGSEGVTAAAARALGIPRNEIKSLVILRRSIDARRKNAVIFVFSVAVEIDDEAKFLKKKRGRFTRYTPVKPYRFPYSFLSPETRPVVVGMGPAGLFAALCLAEAGAPPVIIERGQPVEQRVMDVERFWETGRLDTASNVQFGEGGAGTFSDGKLTSGISDLRTTYVLKRFMEFGAPESISYLAKPHIGTDRLRTMLISMRQHLTDLGCDIRFGARLTDIEIENGCVKALVIDGEDGTYTFPAEHIVLAPGNSARDTFEMLEIRGVKLSPKNFSVGVRIEHLQSAIDGANYGEAATLGTLPASDYKLAVHPEDGHSVYTFCVCPGGQVVAAASEEGHLVTNGMSYYARDGENCNGGLLVSVSPEDFGHGALDGIAFQRRLEEAAFKHGGGDFRAPAQLVGDFLAKTPSAGPGSVLPTYKPGVTFCNLWDVLPDFVCRALAEAIPEMDRKIRGFAHPDAVLTAVETRSSCPVRIERTEGQSVSVKGLYPAGEGAGYAGGIMSAAVDGIRAAEALCAHL